MKYLKLIIDKEIEGHITFMFFGKYPVDTSVLEKELDTIFQFELVFYKEDMFGEKADIPAYVYSISSDQDIVNIRKDLLNKLGLDIANQNYKIWSPHISNPVSGTPKSFKVLGVESNDGTFKYNFHKKIIDV